MPDLPNILFIGTDQHRFDCVGVNGNIARTPNLDRLAAEGVNFTQAYTPCPVCTPARASLLTGQWPVQHKCLTIPNWTEVPRRFDPNLPTWPTLLKKKGYQLGYVGKWHLGENGRDDTNPSPLDVGFDQYIPESKYFEWRKKQGLPDYPAADWSSQHPAVIGKGCVDAVRPEDSRVSWTAQKAIDLLKEYAARQAPFFLRWDPSEPHLPNVVPQPYADMFDPASLNPWKNFEDDFHDKPYIQQKMLDVWNIRDWTWSQWAPIVARYLGEIALLDSQIGRLLEALDQSGLANNTVVIYTTDHGDMCGSHRMIDKHFIMYDEVVRVPLIIRWPDKINPGQIFDGFVSHAIDLASTLCEMADVEIPASFQGQSLLSAVTGQDRRHVRDSIFCTYHGAQFGLYSQRMVRNEQWKYVWNPTDIDELYDVKADCGELNNLANQQNCRHALNKMRKTLVQWMETTSDPLLNPWNRPWLEQAP